MNGFVIVTTRLVERKTHDEKLVDVTTCADRFPKYIRSHVVEDRCVIEITLMGHGKTTDIPTASILSEIDSRLSGLMEFHTKEELGLK